MTRRSQSVSDRIVERGTASSGAVFDATGKFRYLLWRHWDRQLPALCFIMLNPSTADDIDNDPTISRCVGFAKRWNFGSLHVVNAFAYRATDSRKLYRVRDPIGPLNDEFVSRAIADCDEVVIAWGNHGALKHRHARMIELVKAPAWCLGTTKSGQPRHPLYVRNDAPLMPFPG